MARVGVGELVLEQRRLLVEQRLLARRRRCVRVGGVAIDAEQIGRALGARQQLLQVEERRLVVGVDARAAAGSAALAPSTSSSRP